MAVLSTSGPLAPAAVAARVSQTYSMAVTEAAISPRLRELEDAENVIRLPDGRYRLTEACRTKVAEDDSAFLAMEAEVRSRFAQALRDEKVPLDPAVVWEEFSQTLLRPLIAELGARTWELMEGRTHLAKRTSSLARFLDRFDADLAPGLENTLLRFLDPHSVPVRRYVLYHLNAYFLLAAGRLDAGALASILDAQERGVVLNFVLDTNFVFSILGLHDNPSNDAAKALLEIAAKTHDAVEVNFGVLSITLEEARRAIDGAFHHMNAIRWSMSVAEGLLATERLSGMAQAFARHYLDVGGKTTPDAYFQPYREGLRRILESKGIDVFVDDLSVVRERESVRAEIRGIVEDFPRSSYKQVEHDVVLWHFISEARPCGMASPLDAQSWIVSVDFGFLDYDQRLKAGGVPIVLHPTHALQLLEFWVSRTPEMERAVLHSFRLPFMFYDYDAEAERTTLAIITSLTRYEAGTDLSADVIRDILTDSALAQRISDPGVDDQARQDAVESAAIDRLAAIEASREELTAELDEARSAADSARKTAQKRKQETDAARAELNETRRELDRQVRLREDEARTADTRIAELESFVDEMRVERNARTTSRNRWKVRIVLACVLLLLAAAALAICVFFVHSRLFRVSVGLGGLILWAEISERIVRYHKESAAADEWGLAKAVGRLHGWVSGVGVFGVAVSVIIQWSTN